MTKQGFCKILWRNLRLRGSLLLALTQFFSVGMWKGVGWGGRLFEAGRLLTFSAFRMGAFSRWTLIRGWGLIRINTVSYTLNGTFELKLLYAFASLSNIHLSSLKLIDRQKLIHQKLINTADQNSWKLRHVKYIKLFTVIKDRDDFYLKYFVAFGLSFFDHERCYRHHCAVCLFALRCP